MISCSGSARSPAPTSGRSSSQLAVTAVLRECLLSSFLRLHRMNKSQRLGQMCPLGTTEARAVLLEECLIKDISKLIASREGDFSLSSNQGRRMQGYSLCGSFAIEKTHFEKRPNRWREALQILKKGAHIDPKIILDEAITRGYSSRKMFSIVENANHWQKSIGNCQQSSVIDSKAMQVHCLHELINNILNGTSSINSLRR
ncbi:hypothetical protein Ocin01_19481 [Orchesella cincta]|uniref:Uncharacterized protein n=1 Tax=Orchesella cincta TaxID=48709 RepID=A0A1D2M2N4_ORCCI|nr:hypothetical protein Ocin01_19481 [Orchesella cincta]